MKIENINLQGRWIKGEINITQMKENPYWKSVILYLNISKPISIYLRSRDETYAVFGFDKISDKKCALFIRYGQMIEKINIK